MKKTIIGPSGPEHDTTIRVQYKGAEIVLRTWMRNGMRHHLVKTCDIRMPDNTSERLDCNSYATHGIASKWQTNGKILAEAARAVRFWLTKHPTFKTKQLPLF